MSDSNPGPGNNVFTVLMLVSALALLLTVGYTWFRFHQVFNTWNPIA
ncbi:MAG: hypothetical protein V3V20_05440 [Algisphaera sp.]